MPVTQLEYAYSPEEWSRLKQLFANLDPLSVDNQALTLRDLEREEPRLANELRRMLGERARSNSAIQAALLPKHPFGPYKIVGLIGQGGMGDVYEGIDEITGRVAAIKCPPLSHDTPEQRRRFDREWRALAALQHPNIAQLYTADFLADGTPWFAMERVKGESITHYVWKRDLPFPVVLRLFLQLCEAVQFAHQKLIVHGDIKPSNVLVTDDGIVKLLDFSIANPNDAADESRINAHFEGSVAYASLEQLRKQRPTVASDVHSLAVLLHELLSGRRPYELTANDPDSWVRTVEGLEPPRIRHAIAEQLAQNAREVALDFEEPGVRRPVAVDSAASEDWRDIDAFLAESLSSTSEDRYATVAAQITDLRNLLEHKPLNIRHSNGGYVVRCFLRRRPVETLVGFVVLAAISTAASLYARSTAARRDAFVAQTTNNRLRQFLDDLFLGVSNGSASATSIRAITLVENGAKEARALRHDAPLRKDMLETIGILSQHLGRVASAESLFKEAAVLADSLYEADDPEAIRPRLRLARVLSEHNQFDSAFALLKIQEQRARSRRNSTSPVLSEVQLELGMALRDVGKGEEALVHLRQAMALLGNSDSTSREYYAVLREMSNAYATIPNLAAADSIQRQALPLVRARLGNQHPDVAYLLANMGRAASLRGQLDEAEARQREATEIIESWYGRDSFYTGLMYGNLAQTLVRQRRYASAESVSRRAIETLSNAADAGPNSRWTAISHSTLGSLLQGVGRHAEAITEYAAAIHTLNEIVGLTDRNNITTTINFASALMRTGARDSSMRVFRRTMEGARTAYGDSSIVVAQIRVKLGDAYVMQERYRDAIVETAGAIHIIDSLLSPRSDIAILARKTLISSYSALRDTTNARRVQSELDRYRVTTNGASSPAPPPASPKR